VSTYEHIQRITVVIWWVFAVYYYYGSLFSCVQCCSTDVATHQLSGFATAEQFEAAFGQEQAATTPSDFSTEPAANEGNSTQYCRAGDIRGQLQFYPVTKICLHWYIFVQRTKFEAENYHFWGNLGAKLNPWAPISPINSRFTYLLTYSVGNLLLSLEKWQILAPRPF